jgi:hypothetical protein
VPERRRHRSRHPPPVSALAATAAGGSLVLVQLLALEADPVALLLAVGAERGGHQGHAAAWADRRTVVVIHAMSIPGSTALSLEDGVAVAMGDSPLAMLTAINLSDAQGVGARFAVH